ncbi:hypothetical protein BRAO375_4770015 [Bradyrhizobium sp. ORS 375]|uniref:molybdopterin cofactor-binding domain-containing protein n=1 Tax=Bradyrhizobium sp. (strain ORS 375) TaxID=566679 RepID=UPI0002408608|nr:molybdopterin cofactor-binding domain-containing protein [Bradyrhizobium sp. ORS 375]CCD95814.1 hypothetical protein BRAO375_4770015 [Bradyrhizobium sp. ORS 375]
MRLSPGALEACAENTLIGIKPEALDQLYSGQPPMSRGHSRQDVTAYAFGAHFAEVRVHRRTCEIRVPRMVGAFACGTIVNPLTAYSQFMGGMIRTGGEDGDRSRRGALRQHQHRRVSHPGECRCVQGRCADVA